MELLPLAEKLDEGFMTQIKRAKKIKSSCVGHGDPNISELQDLERDLIQYQEIAKHLVQKIKEAVELSPARIKELEKEVKHLKEIITKQSDKIKDIEAKLSAVQTELGTLKNSLQTGQLSFDFEKDLATYIYPEGKKIGSRKIFTTMKKWLEDKRGTQGGDAANKKWDDLKKEFSWSDEHEKVFFKLLEYRKKFAHPARDGAEMQIPDDFTDEEKRYIQTINDMIERINKLME